ncbi:MAG: hypothetical protein H6738_15530 [Alphaproteobacteria bacterium]|nr:hypothetical protein [Alphaproteobacteria bacterium]MCB9698189.1 hypothetical protein [Alphaproteobacteria bacterium]
MSEGSEAREAVAVDHDLRELARSAWTFGLLSMGMSMLTMCSSGMTALMGLPLGLIAMARARAVLESSVPLDEATELYAKTGRIAGLSGALFSGLYIVLVGSFVLLYVGMIVAMFGVIGASMPPPAPPAPAFP